MKQVLVCKNCEQELTQPVDMPEHSIQFSDIVGGGYQKETITAVEAGLALKIKERPVMTIGQTSRENVVWLNQENILNRVELITKGEGVYGCCGSLGPNSRCKCGEIIGSQYDDCWLVHHFEVFADKTYWINFIEDEVERELAKQARFYKKTRQTRRHNRHKK